MSKKQKTLFESWNKISSSLLPDTSNHNSHMIDRNVFNAVQQFPNLCSTQSSSSPFQPQRFSKKSDELADPEFDYEAGKTWIYPTNYPIRNYQFSIVQEALYKNTLVVLPTGLGKTFIAAVVMYNIYRWFPNGKVVFMAPTKPLVAQQIDACVNITGIPEQDTTQMTGTNAPELRKRMWQKKRVFFLTPQVLVNDLVRNICPSSCIKCVVVDEAHKALGNHAYCQVIKELCTYTSDFRILALTATPGSETQAVKQVLTNLLISHVEMRSEDSEDVQQYIHTRDLEKIVVPLGGRLNNLKSKFLDVINVYLKRLTLRKAMTAKNPGSLSKFQVFKLREAFSKHPPANMDRISYGLSLADFSLCISLYHAYELLLLHGATSFYNFLTGILNGDKSIPHTRSELLKNFEFQEIFQNVKETYIQDPVDQNAVVNGQSKKRKVLPGHPKLDKLLEVVLQHFETAETNNITDTRVMIFTQYRDSVQEIVDMLNQYQPLIKVMSFIGQSSKSSSNAGYSQKQQLKVIQQFRSGGYNTLVSTCVGEEGLDIGEVDLIVCYDCPKSPIRLVQRMGRTGRLRKGRIIILVAEGKEEQMYNTCEYRKKSVHRAIVNGFSFAQLYQNNPSLIPSGVKPICVKTVVTIPPKKILTKGISKSPFLTDEEIMEFNQHVKVPATDAPLLPKREFVIFQKHEKDEVTTEESNTAHPVKPQLSFSDWTLWQTTPQRTDMIPHSSKSLLLVKILELIHFPELLSPQNCDTVDFADFLDKSAKTSKAFDDTSKIHNLCARSFLKQEKTSNMIQNDIEIVLSPEKEIYEVNMPEFNLVNSSKDLPLIQQLFNIDVVKGFPNVDCNLKLPPSTVQIFGIEEFSHVYIKSFIAAENKNTSILHVLNKKMKAKLRRKSKERGRSTFCNDTQKFVTPEKIVHSPSKKLNTIASFGTSFDILHKSEVKQFQNSQNEQEGILFDIDFDLSDPFEDELHFSADDAQVVNTSPDAHYGKEHTALEDNKKDIDSNYHCDKISDFLSVSPNRNKHTVLQSNEKVMDAASFNVGFLTYEKEVTNSKHKGVINSVSFSGKDEKKNSEISLYYKTNDNKKLMEDNKEDFLLNASSNKNEKTLTALKYTKMECPVKSTSIEINIKSRNIPMSSNMKFHTEFSKDYNPNSPNTNDIIFDSDKSSIRYLKWETTEVGGIGNADDLEQVKKSINKVDNFKTIPSINSGNITNTNFNNSNNFKKRKLSLKKTSNIPVVSESNKKVCSKTLHESSTDLKCSDLSFLPNSNEITEIYRHSFIDKVEKNTNKCSFEFDISFDHNNIKDGSKNVDVTDYLKELDNDSNIILEQLFTSQNNISTDMNTSLSSPLTIKRCISETDKHQESLIKKKFCKSSINSYNLPSSSKLKPNNEQINSFEAFKVPNVKNKLNATKLNSPKSNFNKIMNLADTSQYTLTQLLSFIDCTEKIEKSSSKQSFNDMSNNLQVNSEIDMSSDDEICPTPPKEVIKPNSKFIYNKKSLAKKSLDFPKHSSLQKYVADVQNKSSGFEQKSQSSVLGTSEFKKMKKTIKSDNVASEAVEKNQCDIMTDSIIALKSEMNENKIVELEPSPKISFDVSFDFPFTQADFESSKDQIFDMNNAIIIETSSSEGKSKSDQNNDIDFIKSLCDKNEKFDGLLDEIPSKQIDIFNKNIHQEANYLSDEYDDSESLLPSNQIENDRIRALSLNFSYKDMFSNKIGNNCNPSCLNDDKNFKSNSVNVKEHFSETNKYSYENCAVEAAAILNVSPSKKGSNADFEESIFFKLLPKDSKAPDNLHSYSPSIKFSNNLVKGETNFNNKKVSNLLCNNDHFEELKKTDLNSNLLHFATHSNSSHICKSVNERKMQKDGLNLKYTENSFNDSISIVENEHIPELQQEDIIVKKVAGSEIIKSDSCNSVSLSEDKLCFDLSFDDDDETCDILPRNNPGDSKLQNVNKISDEQSNLQKTDRVDFDDNSLSFEQWNSSKLCIEPKGEGELKKVSKKSIFKKIEVSGESNRSMSKLNAANNEIVWEFDVGSKDQNLGLESVKSNNFSMSHIDQEPTVITIADDNSSDKFDLYNPNKISKFKKPDQVCSKPVTEKHTKFFDGSGSACKIEAKGKYQPCTSRNKCSKLSRKNETRTRTVLKSNSVIEDEENDFQFIKKINKKIDKPSNIRSKKRKQLSNKNEFLLSQAEVSESENSDHESSYDEDAFEGSFIDDELSNRFNCTDQHAFYLKSIKNCAGLPQKFKLKTAKRDNMFPEHDEEYSVYQRDSFCVSDDDVVLLSSEDNEDYNPEMMCINKEKRVNKNTKKKLKRVITHDSSSSDQEISPKIRKVNKKTSQFTDIPNNIDNDSFIGGRKQKHKLVVISSDEENESVFIKPLSIQSNEHHKKNVFHTDNINPKYKSTMPALNSAHDKFEFSVDFGNDDFLTLADVNKIDYELSTNMTIPSNRSLNNNKASVSNFVNKCAVTSKATNCSSSETNNNVVNKETVKIDHPNIKTNSTNLSVSNSSVNFPSTSKSLNYDLKSTTSNKKVIKLPVMQFNNSSNEKAINTNKPRVLNSSLDFPSTSNAINFISLNAESTNDITTFDIDNEIHDISFNIGWDEICPSSNIIEDSAATSENKKITSKPVNVDKNETASIILVDSRELASGKPVISALRNIHKVNPVVMHLQSVDYILSNRLAVERVLDSEFSNTSMPPKVVEKIKEMGSIYEKSIIIIEKDNRKNVLSFNKNVTKYLQFVVYVNCHPSIQILYSKSVEHTSELMANLIQRERKRGFHINVPVILNAKSQKLFNFYSNFPKVSSICALNFMYYFPTVESFLKSSVKDLEKKGCISSHKALYIYNFIKSELTFHKNM